jgi:hypothetical protein
LPNLPRILRRQDGMVSLFGMPSSSTQLFIRWPIRG